MANVQHEIAYGASFRCSHGQQSLWLMDQIAPGNPAYNLHAAVRTPFELLPTPLAAAAAALMERHETLRTVFDWDGYEPVQRVLPRGPSCVQMADLRSKALQQAEAELAHLSRDVASSPFDLREAPLLRLGLVRMPAAQSVLLVTIHHIVSDSWSMNVLLRDLLELYVAEVTGRPPQLPDLPIQYVDFAAWQRDHVDAQSKKDLVEGWRRYLAGTSDLNLPTDHPRRAGTAQSGDNHRFRFSKDLSDACMQRCREFAATPYALITGCFAEVLHRYGCSDDFMIGMPTAGRTRPDLDDLIGFFVRTLVLRVDLTGRPSLRALARRIGASVGDALALQELSFESIVGLVDPDRDLSVNPLFMVTSQFLSNPLERKDGGSIDVVDLHRGFSNFDLTLDFWEENSTIVGRIEYARGLYEPRTIERLVDHMKTLLAAATTDPDAPLATLEMLTQGEQEQILAEWSVGVQEFPQDSDLAGLFSETVARHSNRIALRDAAGEMTYAALETEARALAWRLLQEGVQSGDAVGLCLPRSRAQIVAALAIVLAGAAYVALDTDWPDARIDRIIDLAEIRTVVTDDDVGRWQERDMVVVASSEPSAGEAVAGRMEPVTRSPDAWTYVAFTSGSTGEPKGVPTTHRAVIRLMRGGAPFEFAPDDVMLGFAPLGFDASTFEIWGPLLNGGCLAIAPEGPLSPHELADFIEAAAVTKAWLTAGLFSQVAVARARTLAKLRAVFAGGDVLSEPAVRRVLDLGGTVINGYGPTENTVFTCHSIMHGAAAIDKGIAIGRPVPGTYVYVLDPLDRPTPIGIPGELVAGGAGVSAGYLGGHPASARFTPDPIDPRRGRVYRTGDLVRWREDGEIEFLGRNDRQVKIRGFRVEPGEIEKAILQDGSVSDCTVVVRGTDADEKALVAYVVFDEATQQSIAGLRRVLAARLPAHSRPTSIIAVPRMPLGENGKVDVAALLALCATAEHDGGTDGTLSETEDLVAETFADVLRCAHVPVDCSFFDLGGHSLHATRVVTRLREMLGVELPLQAIFEAPTVRGLSARLEEILLTEFEPEMEGTR